MALDLKKSVGKLSLKTDKIKKLTSKVPRVKVKAKYLTWKYILVLFAVIVVLFLTVMSVGIYKYGWSDKFTKGVVTVVPYPAALVNGKIVYYYDYIEQVGMVKRYESEYKGMDFATDEGKERLDVIKTKVMTSLINDALIRAEAKKDKVVLSSKEIDEAFASFIESNGGSETFDKLLKDYYDITSNRFKKDIYKKSLLAQKLNEKFSTDESLNVDAKNKAEEILVRVKNGEDFATLAKEFSEDTANAASGGDLGLFGKGTMLQEFEDVAFALQAGQVSDKVVKTIFGYHIIKVTEVSGEQIRASHILIKTKDLDTWLADALQDAKINIWLKAEPFLTKYDPKEVAETAS